MKHGTNYSLAHHAAYPLHGGQADPHALKTAMDSDFAQIKQHFGTIRTFYSSFYGVPVVPSAAAAGLKVYLGVFVTDQDWYKYQVSDAVTACEQHPNTVEAVLVGNENITIHGHGPGPYSPHHIQTLMQEVRQKTHHRVPVGTVQRITDWLEKSSQIDALAEASDIIGVNIYPFFTRGTDLRKPTEKLDDMWNQLVARFPQHVDKFRLTETGWPTKGQTEGNTGSMHNAEIYYKAFMKWHPPRGSGGKTPTAFWFSYYDRKPDDPMIRNVGAFEESFGLVTANGGRKYHLDGA